MLLTYLDAFRYVGILFDNQDPLMSRLADSRTPVAGVATICLHVQAASAQQRNRLHMQQAACPAMQFDNDVSIWPLA